MKKRNVAVFLSIILALLVLSAVVIYVIIPANRHYYVTNIQFPVYGGMTRELKDCELYEDFRSGKSFCFLGDSITIGTVTGGIPWYQPLAPYIKGSISNLSYPGWTAYNLLDHKDSFPDAEIYVIAIGVNDILYINKYAASSSEFVERCDLLAKTIENRHPNAKIYFISPWPFYGFDKETVSRGNEFRSALESWCSGESYIYIDPNPIIASQLSKDGVSKYMYNENHPNSPEGIGLFCYAVLKANHYQRKDGRSVTT